MNADARALLETLPGTKNDARMTTGGNTWRLAAALFLVGVANSNHTNAAETHFTPTQICKAGIAVIMGRDPATMKIDRVEKDVIYLSYIRADDRKRWAYKCKVQGKQILWGADDGRWQNHPADSVITFSASTSMLTVVERYSDGTSTKEHFTLKELGR